MTEDNTASGGAPWHLALVAGLGLLWNAFLGYNLFGAVGVSGEMFAGESAWVNIAWSVGVLGGLLGCGLLLMRRRAAPLVLLVSLVGLLAGAYAYYGPMGLSGITGQQAWIMGGLIAVVAVFLALYGHRAKSRGVLA